MAIGHTTTSWAAMSALVGAKGDKEWKGLTTGWSANMILQLAPIGCTCQESQT